MDNREGWYHARSKARELARNYMPADEERLAQEHLVEYLGSGISRSVFGINKKWVVKIGDPMPNRTECRLWEYANANNHPAVEYLAATLPLRDDYSAVIQERVDGQFYDGYYEMADVLIPFGVVDLHPGNYRDGKAFDFGFVQDEMEDENGNLTEAKHAAEGGTNVPKEICVPDGEYYDSPRHTGKSQSEGRLIP